ncbi:MAG TPA: hypothetical protein VHO66_10150, partial [Ruminiclostridium sp.]|nr:hypothetical protein [Ruminiclostridium sp.]
MKRKYFDRNLFVEGLSQIKMAGTILFIISFLGSLLVPFSRWFKIIEYQRQGISVTNLLRPVRITEIAPIIIPFIYVAPFIFCFILFAFLNKRNSSDFYHSLSCRRITIFNSFTASAMLWIAATVIICVSTSGIVYQLLGIHVYFSYIIWLIGTFIAGALLVFSCMLLAMSATGTTFTNIVLFGLIFFLPRFIFLMFGKALTSAVNILIIKDTNIVNYSNNIPIKFIFRFILNDNSTNSNQLYSSLSAIVYTLIIAVIYFCLAGIIFNKRKSEAAGSSAPNSILQHVYRCVVTLPV